MFYLLKSLPSICFSCSVASRLYIPPHTKMSVNVSSTSVEYQNVVKIWLEFYIHVTAINKEFKYSQLLDLCRDRLQDTSHTVTKNIVKDFALILVFYTLVKKDYTYG